MSNEIPNTDHSSSEVTPSLDLESKTEFIATINTTNGNVNLETDLSGEEFVDEEEYTSDSSYDRPSKIKEEARRKQLDYEQALREKLEWDGTYHPGVDKDDLVQSNHGHIVVSQDWFDNDKSLNYRSFLFDPRLRELCHNCGLNNQQQTSPAGYTSRLKIKYLKGGYGLWEAGPEWFIRDEINNDWNGSANSYKAQKFIRENVPEVPLVEMHRFGKKEDKYALTVMSRAKGVLLREIEGQLTREQKYILAKDLTSYMMKWRKLTAPRMQTADGKPLRDFIFRCDNGPCQDVPFDATEWIEKLVPAWRKALFKAKCYRLWDEPRPKGRFPENWIREVDEKMAKIKTILLNEGGLLNEEFVFTHGDLHDENIFVFEETPGIYKISAIIDWEFAGYCPWWVEWYYCQIGLIGGFRELVMSKERSTTLFKILDALSDILDTTRSDGEDLFKHTPNDKNEWYGRPFCKCEPFCTRYRSDEAFAVKHPHEVTFDVTENYPDSWIEFHKMWNHLVQSEGRPNSLTMQYTGGETE
ncbi:uncharacterized protein LY89DRAFT_678950 [Mollisia scopiformis]|uniref:Aminoglycoside phosphotransferase domain-containing protein n=1 Tax=Mollisia scopiformis TaxID=149040 RepID=A0A132B1G2_MOLSC|nr:uncharacterized protein LY89DRAFT_678950 [Mollisia scopiformis]KUJ06222.1 hypothetical protein LY89DRAFT_678950 [Mollisia scopiformis]